MQPAWRQAASTLPLLWLATVAGALMPFLAQTLFARRSGPADYGLFVSSLTTVMMVAPLAGFGQSQFRLKAYGTEGWAAERWLLPSLYLPIRFLSTAVGSVLFTEDHVRYRVWATASAAGVAIVAIVANLMLVPRHLELGAAWATVIAKGRCCTPCIAV